MLHHSSFVTFIKVILFLYVIVSQNKQTGHRAHSHWIVDRFTYSRYPFSKVLGTYACKQVLNHTLNNYRLNLCIRLKTPPAWGFVLLSPALAMEEKRNRPEELNQLLCSVVLQFVEQESLAVSVRMGTEVRTGMEKYYTVKTWGYFLSSVLDYYVLK